jgi:KamA family protein
MRNEPISVRSIAVPPGVLPVKVTSRYRRLIDEEVEALGREEGPLYRVAYPVRGRELMRAGGEVPDFVDDRANMPPGLDGIGIRKYQNRILFLSTDTCAGHCTYCFRQDVLTEQHGTERIPFEGRVSRLVEFLKLSPEIEEVIFSGGDPLTIPLTQLRFAIQELNAVATVRHIRIHTRALAYSPQLFSEPLAKLLGESRIRLVLHIVHPYELDDAAAAAADLLSRHRVRLYSQFPVLRGINDHHVVLTELLTKLDLLHIRPISLFVADPINYAAIYRVPLKRLFSLIDDMNRTTPAWVNSVRLVLDTPIGKMRREDISSWSASDNRVTFARDGQSVEYFDLPEHLDAPTDLATLLWRGIREGAEPTRHVTNAIRSDSNEERAP